MKSSHPLDNQTTIVDDSRVVANIHWGLSIIDAEQRDLTNKFTASPAMYEELKRAKEWLVRFVMRFYVQAENPTYEKMKALYQELDTFQRELGEQALAKAEGR